MSQSPASGETYLLQAMVRIHIHATEDGDRLAALLDDLLPKGKPERDQATGHYGNPILTLVTRSRSRRVITDLLERLGTQFSPGDLAGRFDEGGEFQCHLDKQALVLGRMVPGKGVWVHIKAITYPADRVRGQTILMRWLRPQTAEGDRARASVTGEPS